MADEERKKQKAGQSLFTCRSILELTNVVVRNLVGGDRDMQRMLKANALKQLLGNQSAAPSSSVPLVPRQQGFGFQQPSAGYSNFTPQYYNQQYGNQMY